MMNKKEHRLDHKTENHQPGLNSFFPRHIPTTINQQRQATSSSSKLLKQPVNFQTKITSKDVFHEQCESRSLKLNNHCTGVEAHRNDDQIKEEEESKGQVKNSTPKKNQEMKYHLKQTSSTNSADACVPQWKHAPAFLKEKKRKMSLKLAHEKRNIQRFRIIKRIGEGKFGKVYLVEDLETGFMMALKMVQKKKIIAENLLDQLIRQLKIQSFLDHPNIVRVYGFFDDEKFFYTLMELGCDGQLYDLILSRKNITEQATSFIIKNLLEATSYMHQLKILHRDIKPENIVLIMGSVKICDFGWAANKLTKQELRSTYCGTPLYLSPQLLSGNKYDEKVDIWAIGILAYQLLIGHSPFRIFQQVDLLKIVTDQISIPKKVSKEFQQFITCILDKDPNRRLDSVELRQLGFIKKYEQLETCEELCH